MSLWRNPKHKIWVDDGFFYEIGCTEAENIKVIARKAATRWKGLLKRLAENDELDATAPEE